MIDQQPGIFQRYLCLAIMLLLAAGICFYRIDRIPLDGDEAVTANIATGFGYIRIHPFDGFAKYEPVDKPVFSSADYWKRNSAERTMRFTIDDCGHSFTSNLIIHYWINIRGFSVAAMREPSALFVLLAIGLFHVWARRKLGDVRAANVATLLFMLHALVIQVAHFARMYGLALLLMMVLLLLYDGIQKAIVDSHKKKQVIYGILLGVTAALLLVTHYITVIILAALLVDFIAVNRRQQAGSWWRICVAVFIPFCVLLLIYLFPLNAIKSILSIIEMNRIASNLSIPRKYFTPATPLTIVWGFLCRFTTILGNSASSEIDVKGLMNILLMIFPLFIIVAGFRKAIELYGKRTIYFLLCGIVVYTAFSLAHILITHTTVILHARYWIFCLPFSLSLLAACFIASQQSGRKLIQRICMICLALMLCRMAFTCVAYVYDLRYSVVRNGSHISLKEGAHWNGEWTENVADKIKSGYTAGDTVSFNNHVWAQQVNWYLRNYPQIPQRVDTLQKSVVRMVSKNGAAVVLYP